MHTLWDVPVEGLGSLVQGFRVYVCMCVCVFYAYTPYAYNPHLRHHLAHDPVPRVAIRVPLVVVCIGLERT